MFPIIPVVPLAIMAAEGFVIARLYRKLSALESKRVAVG